MVISTAAYTYYLDGVVLYTLHSVGFKRATHIQTALGWKVRLTRMLLLLALGEYTTHLIDLIILK